MSMPVTYKHFAPLELPNVNHKLYIMIKATSYKPLSSAPAIFY